MSRSWMILLTLAAIFFAPSALAGGTTLSGQQSAKVFDYKSSQTLWENKGDAVYQRSDGQWSKVTPGGATETAPAPKSGWLDQWNPRVQHNFARGSTTASDQAMSFNNEAGQVDVLGTQGRAIYSVDLNNDGLVAKSSVNGRAYLSQVKIAGASGSWGDDTAKISTAVSGNGFVGTDGAANVSTTLGTKGVSASAGASAFAGGKAMGRVPITTALCNLVASLTMSAEASYGLGASANGSVGVDWSNLKFEISGKLAATLGIGTGAGGSVKVELGALLSDTKGTLDCLRGKLQDLAQAAADAGTSLLGAADRMIASAGDTLSAAGRALANGLERVNPLTGVVDSLFRAMNPSGMCGF